MAHQTNETRNVPGRRKRFAHRSRTSCLECRRDHQKCDECRPACTRCRQRAQNCTYGLRISWGRRDLSPSTFGQDKAGTGKGREPTAHIHTVCRQNKGSQVTRASLSKSATTDCAGSMSANWHRYVSVRICDLSLFPGLLVTEFSLLDYFMHAVDSFSCNRRIKDQLCRVIMPMAIQSGPLMASILSLAAVHRANAGLVQDSKQMSALQLSSIQKLRSSLSEPLNEPVMAAALMLCYTDVVSGGHHGSSWRLHLEGAASLFALQPSSWSIDSPDCTRAFICKCFVSLAALANVSKHPPTNAVSQRAQAMIGRNVPCYKIDDFMAYSTELMHIFFDIGTVLRESQRVGTDTTPGGRVPLQKRASHLLQRLNMVPTTSTKLRLDDQSHHINELFRLAAMLQVKQRLVRFLPTSTEIQHLVTRILSLLAELNLHRGPSCSVLLFFPAFSAGTGAVVGAHRQQVRDLLAGLVKIMGFVSIQQGLDVLEALWSHWDQFGVSDIDVSWENFVGEGLDVILY